MFRFKTQKEQMLEERRKREALQARQASIEVATRITFVTLAETGTIDEETATEHIDLFSPWVDGIAYKMGDIRSYEGKLYRCEQSHTAQDGWEPPVTPALWTEVAKPGKIPEWKQPTGAQDAYNKGDQVRHAEKIWTSDIDGNVWEPGVYGWTEMEE